MLLKTSLALVCMASVASSTFLTVMPKCWRKCAREAGVMCQWTDIPCLCKTANNGLHAKANTCACHNCDDHEFGDDDHAKVTLKEFSFACKVAMTPLDQAVFDATYSAATCPGSHAPLTSSYASVTVPTSLFKPSSVAASSSSKSAGYGYGIGSGAYDSTQIIQSTVVVIPVPVTQSSGHTVTHTGTGTATVTGSKVTAAGTKTGTKTGAQPTQFSGAAIRRDVTGSVFALAAALAYGIA